MAKQENRMSRSSFSVPRSFSAAVRRSVEAEYTIAQDTRAARAREAKASSKKGSTTKGGAAASGK